MSVVLLIDNFRQRFAVSMPSRHSKKEQRGHVIKQTFPLSFLGNNIDVYPETI